MLQDYFETVDRVPDKIIYVQTSNTRTISIEDDNYRFTQYVKQNYSLDDEETIENTYYVQVYSKEQDIQNTNGILWCLKDIK